jgi:hypothetical protein
MLPLDAGSGKVEAQTPTAKMVSEHLSDMVIADAIAHAIRGDRSIVGMQRSGRNKS